MNFTASSATHSYYPVESRVLAQPSLAELALVLQTALSTNYAQTSVTVVDCPDLTKPPYLLMKPGLSGGQQAYVDVASLTYLLPQADHSRRYNFVKLADQLNLRGHAIFGSTTNLKFDQLLDVQANVFIPTAAEKNGFVNNNSNLHEINENRLFFVTKDLQQPNATATFAVHKASSMLNDEEANEFTFEGNFYASHGDAGQVLRIHVQNRTGTETDFTYAIEKALKEHYVDTPVALGGVFSVVNGSIRMYIPLKGTTDSEFFTSTAPQTFVSTIVSRDFDGLDLRLRHAHGYGPGGCGNYVNDNVADRADAENLEYIGYFNVAKVVYKVDKQQDVSRTRELKDFLSIYCQTHQCDFLVHVEQQNIASQKMREQLLVPSH